MKTKQYNYTKFVADDGSKFDTELEAANRNNLLTEVKIIENYLGGPQNKQVADNKGYYQHSTQKVTTAWEKVIKLSRPYFKGYEKMLSATPEEIHPMGFGGRLISECEAGPINQLWWRFSCIDKDGREWQQPYFALNAGTGEQKQIN